MGNPSSIVALLAIFVLVLVIARTLMMPRRRPGQRALGAVAPTEYQNFATSSRSHNIVVSWNATRDQLAVGCIANGIPVSYRGGSSYFVVYVSLGFRGQITLHGDGRRTHTNQMTIWLIFRYDNDVPIARENWDDWDVIGFTFGGLTLRPTASARRERQGGRSVEFQYDFDLFEEPQAALLRPSWLHAAKQRIDVKPLTSSPFFFHIERAFVAEWAARYPRDYLQYEPPQTRVPLGPDAEARAEAVAQFELRTVGRQVRSWLGTLSSLYLRGRLYHKLYLNEERAPGSRGTFLVLVVDRETVARVYFNAGQQMPTQFSKLGLADVEPVEWDTVPLNTFVLEFQDNQLHVLQDRNYHFSPTRGGMVLLVASLIIDRRITRTGIWLRTCAFLAVLACLLYARSVFYG